jgi:hypothetical protein
MAKTKSRGPNPTAPSIVFSALIVFGMVLTLVGAVAALLGPGGFSQNAFSGLGFRISAVGPGLVIATLGVTVIFIATRKTRGGVRVFGVVPRMARDRVADFAPWLLLAMMLIDLAALLWALLGYALERLR